MAAHVVQLILILSRKFDDIGGVAHSARREFQLHTLIHANLRQ